MFVSLKFILFLLVTLFIYYILPKKCQWIVLLAANFVFYFSAGVTYPVYILFTAITVYTCAIILERNDNRINEYKKDVKNGNISSSSNEENKNFIKRISKRKKLLIGICLLLNIGILATVKYSEFFLENINRLFDVIDYNRLDKINFIVPMGISFYTFQSVAYLLDVYWGKYKPQKNIFKFILFISFFPQLIQGPINRYNNVSESLYRQHHFDKKMVTFGAQRILWGYFKKLVIADRIGLAVSMMVSDPEYYNGSFVLVYMVLYAIQLYSDFTGGIDIALGCAECFGVKLDENFQRPFFSKSIAEYWRRWHISMGNWFRDYVFYPCSLSRGVKKLTKVTKKRFGMKAARKVTVYFSTMVAWFATGIWHGAAWSYVAWGVVNGVIIIISEECTPLYKAFHSKFPGLANNVIYRCFQIARTFVLMCFVRMFDNFNSVRTSIKQVASIFLDFDISKVNVNEMLELGLSVSDYFIVGAGVIIMFLVSMCNRSDSLRETVYAKPYILKYSLFIIILFSIILFGTYGIGFDSRQFIYNQF